MSSSLPPCFPVQNIRSFLSGKWSLERKITDRFSGIVGVFTGSASLETDKSKARVLEGLRQGHVQSHKDVLVYREEGQVRFSEPQVRVCRATRQYLYAFPMHEEEGMVSSSVDVYFEDGRFFHSLSLADGKHKAWHLCGEDHYNAEYEVISDTEWRCTWKVTGPRKDQVLETTFHRIAEPP